jgi:CheY-like chemotaxis protein
MLCFEVEDTGPGIAPERLQDIFLPFHQVGDPSRWAEGTGLGLTISRELASLMGGDLTVDSRPGAGSTFRVRLPVTVVSDAAVCAAPAHDTGRHIVGYEGRRRRILIVDDTAENRQVVLEMLASLGFELLEAASGEAALQLTAERAPDLVLMDLRMPGLDGLEATRRIRASGGTRPIVVVAMSANVFREARDASAAAGCDDFLAKPLSLPVLLERLGLHLGLTWLTREAPDASAGGTLLELDLHDVPDHLPDHVLDALRDRMLAGDVAGIEAELDRLIRQDPRLAALAAELRALVRGFRMRELRRRVAALVGVPSAG